MSILSRFMTGRRTSAKTAKERLQIIISQERGCNTGPDYLPILKNELMAVIAKYVEIDLDQINIDMETNGTSSTIALSVNLPDKSKIKINTKLNDVEQSITKQKEIEHAK